MVDKPLLLQFHHQAIVDDIVDFQRAAGLARRRLFHLHVHALPVDQRQLLEQLVAALVGAFQERFIIMARVFGHDFFAFLFARLEKMRRFDQRHQ